MKRQEILFVDGYNMIGAWPELAHLKKHEALEAARDLLLFELSSYRKYREIDTYVVFDAQNVPGISQSYEEYELTVIFTEQGETADSYIERSVRDFIHPLNQVRVATSDSAEQWIIFQQGALRVSAQELYMDIQFAKKQINAQVESHFSGLKRRRSPWKIHQLLALERLRQDIEDQT